MNQKIALKKALVPILALFVSSASMAITDENEYFNLFCEEEKSIGFDWKEGNRVERSYTTDKFIITKLEHHPDYLLCNEDELASGWEYDFAKQTNSCYSLRKFGNEPNHFNEIRICEEIWTGLADGGHKLTHISCSEHPLGFFEFSPNGEMSRAVLTRPYITADYLTAKPEDNKYSILISQGKCSTL